MSHVPKVHECLIILHESGRFQDTRKVEVVLQDTRGQCSMFVMHFSVTCPEEFPLQ